MIPFINPVKEGKMKYFNWLWLIVLILGGCSQANVRGNETIRTYNITVNNDNQSMLTMTMPLSVDAIATESLSQTTDNDPATTTDTPISLAAQGATATTAAKGATQALSEFVSDYKAWQDFRKRDSDNDNSVTPLQPVPEPVEPVLPPVVVVPVDPEEPPPVVDPEDPPPVDPPSDTLPKLSDIEWLHTDVSGWPVTAKLGAVSTTSSTITLPYDKAKVWPATHYSASSPLVNANPWVFVKVKDKWYAATFEWFRPGQTSKKKSSVNGDHIKTSPLKDWSPVKGETYYFMVSGLARTYTRNVQERSNIVEFVWK